MVDDDEVMTMIMMKSSETSDRDTSKDVLSWPKPETEPVSGVSLIFQKKFEALSDFSLCRCSGVDGVDY